VCLITPNGWANEPDFQDTPTQGFAIQRLAVIRPGDVNRHRYRSTAELRSAIESFCPDVIDIHEEPFSAVTHQVLSVIDPDVPVVMYSAQNIDKRYPPPFHQYEHRALERATVCYPCSRQAAAVLRAKGFCGHIEVLPLGYDNTTFFEGDQSLKDVELVMVLAGRLVPEKGIMDAVEILSQVHNIRPTRLVLAGHGPEQMRAIELAQTRGVERFLDVQPWLRPDELAALYRSAHVVLVPSYATSTWTEQFGRTIVEAHASGALVAGYATGAIPEVVGDAGILARQGDWLRLAEEILAVVGNADGYAQYRSLGRALSKDRTWDAVADRHADLYRRANSGDCTSRPALRSAKTRRQLARKEFGPTAATPSGTRPFAVPILRRGGIPAGAIGRIIDGFAEPWVARARGDL